MVQEIYWLGSAPAEEECAQVGDLDYTRNARAECQAYVEAIRRVCGREPDGARLAIKSQPHDYGNYLECCIVFDPEVKAARDYAALVDEKAPTTWAEAGMTAPESGRRR